jgi:hypothetical protein
MSLQFLQIITLLHFLQLNHTPQEKQLDCSHDDATTPGEHFGQYTSFNLHMPISSGVKSEMVDLLVAATDDLGIQ